MDTYQIVIFDNWEVLPPIRKEVNDEELFLLILELPKGYNGLNIYLDKCRTLISDRTPTELGIIWHNKLKESLLKIYKSIDELKKSAGIK